MAMVDLHSMHNVINKYLRNEIDFQELNSDINMIVGYDATDLLAVLIDEICERDFFIGKMIDNNEKKLTRESLSDRFYDKFGYRAGY